MTTITITLSDEMYTKLKAVSDHNCLAPEEFAAAVVEREVVQRQSTSRTLTRDEEMRLVREAMGSRLWTQEDIDRFFDALGLTPMTDEEAQRIIDSMPPLDPPLSQTIIDMRNEERY